MNDRALRMTSSGRNRQQDEPAFVLHSYPFRETSLILDVFSRHHGRLAIVARGARRPKSSLRGVLMNFQPLLLSWFGKGEVRTLHSAEWQGGQPYLQGTALMCGFYLNELLLNLLARDDPHQQLFDYYRATLYRLAHETDHAATLRCFEKHLLQELGYALLLDREAGGGKAIQSELCYRYAVERGPLPDDRGPDDGEGSAGFPVLGKTLLDMAADNYADPVTAQQSKQLMRMLLNHHLGGKILHTRELIKELQKL
jgi:DNA repair protein RecO (recombination protein O)